MPGLLLNRTSPRGSTLGVLCALVASVAPSVGCATMIHGPTQRVAVASDPPGARVFLGRESLGVTPTVVTLDRRDPDPGLRFEKDCYRTTVLRVPRRTSQRVATNLLIAGAPVNDYGVRAWLGAMAIYSTVGMLVDRRRGGAFTFPKLVRATLERLHGAPEEAPGGDLEPHAACESGPPAGTGDRGNTSRNR